MDVVQEVQLVNTSVVCAKLTDYPDLFQKIRIYGTVEEPLFVGADLQTTLGLKTIRFDRDFELDEEVKKIKVDTGYGYKLVNALTEQGLYRLLFKSNTDSAKKFRKFVTIILKELRIEGSVTLELAMEKLRLKLDEEQKLRLDAIKKTEKLFIENVELRENYVEQKARVNFKERQPRSGDPEYYLEKVKEHCMKKLYLYLCKPPKEIDLEEYDLDEDPGHDEEYVFTVSFSDEKDDQLPIHIMHVYKEVNLSTLHELFIENGFGISNAQQRYYKKKYLSTVEAISEAVNSLM